MKKIDYETYKTPSDYMKFDQGETIIRIVSTGGLSRKHGLKTKSRWVQLGECTGAGCEHCAKGNLPKLSWIWLVLDRTNKEVKIMDVGKMIGDSIAHMGKQYGDPRNFDVRVKRSGTGLKTSYQVFKGEESELSEEESAIVAEYKPYLVKKYFDNAK